MLLHLRTNANRAEVEAVHRVARELGYEARALGAGGRVVEVVREGGGAPGDRSRFEDLAAVARVLEAGDAPELAERAGREDAVVRIGGAAIGGGSVAVLAGPCAVEDEGRLLEIAAAVRDAGAAVLRGGAFKPRTSPWSFQGLGDEGLARLARARERSGLPVVTEVLDPRDVERVGAVADAFQVGSRSMSNFALLREVGLARRPVLLKRGLAATARELLRAAEYVLAAGNPDVVLCERGVRGFDDVTRNVLDLGTLAWLKRATHLPVVADPSHAAGRADLVPALARAAVAAGADGLIVEVHPAPAEVRSDGAQALSLEAFRRLVDDVRRIAAVLGRELATPAPMEAVP